VPTLSFGVLYCFFIIAHDRRRILHLNATQHPTSAWGRVRSTAQATGRFRESRRVPFQDASLRDSERSRQFETSTLHLLNRRDSSSCHNESQ
jgi:hypothetical protein